MTTYTSSDSGFDAIRAYWVKEGHPANFLYNGTAYMAADPSNVRFITINRGAYPEKADGSKRWDGLYGPYGRQWWVASDLPSTLTNLLLSDGSILLFDSEHSVAITK